MSTKSLHVTLPPSLREFVEQQVKQEHYSTNSDYVQQLMREDMNRQEQQRLAQMFLEGLPSGRKNYTKKEWNDFRGQVIKSVSK